MGVSSCRNCLQPYRGGARMVWIQLLPDNCRRLFSLRMSHRSKERYFDFPILSGNIFLNEKMLLDNKKMCPSLMPLLFTYGWYFGYCTRMYGWLAELDFLKHFMVHFWVGWECSSVVEKTISFFFLISLEDVTLWVWSLHEVFQKVHLWPLSSRADR